MKNCIALIITMLTVLHAQAMYEQNPFESATLWRRSTNGEQQSVVLFLHSEDAKGKLKQDQTLAQLLGKIQKKPDNKPVTLILDLPEEETASGGGAQENPLSKLQSNGAIKIIDYNPSSEILSQPAQIARRFSSRSLSSRNVRTQALQRIYASIFHKITVQKYRQRLQELTTWISCYQQEKELDINMQGARDLVKNHRDGERLSDIMLEKLIQSRSACTSWSSSLEKTAAVWNLRTTVKSIIGPSNTVILYLRENFRFIQEVLSTFYVLQQSESINTIRKLLIPTCATCNEDATKRCAQCQTTFYCSKECQHAAWPIHKKTCMKGTPY